MRALAQKLWLESASGYPNGALLWSQLATGFIEGLVCRHTLDPKRRPPGLLDKAVLRRVRDYVDAHLDESMEIRSLARVAGFSPYHFVRMFARSVGMTPHRYVVELRLHRAIEFIREGRLGLADIAVATGFADQAHLTRWVGRVYGVSPSRMIGEQGQRKSKIADALHASRKRSAAKWHHS